MLHLGLMGVVMGISTRKAGLARSAQKLLALAGYRACPTAWLPFPAGHEQTFLAGTVPCDSVWELSMLVLALISEAEACMSTPIQAGALEAILLAGKKHPGMKIRPCSVGIDVL